MFCARSQGGGSVCEGPPAALWALVNAPMSSTAGFVLGVLICALAWSTGVAGEPAHQVVPEGAAAVVNGAPIPRTAVREIVAGVAAVHGDAQDPSRREEWERSALESLIDFELLYQEAKRQGVSVSGEDVDREIARAKQKFASERDYEKALSERGWTVAGVRADTERSLVVQRFLEGVLWKNVRVPPEQVEEFYNRHREEFRHPAQVRLRHTFVPIAGNSAAAWADAERRAQELRQQWMMRASGNQQENPTEIFDAEDWGWLGRDELSPEVEQAVSKLQVGQVTEPLRGADGFHLFQVTGQRGSGVIPIEEARAKIAAVLLKRERERVREALLEELRRKADIRYR